MLVPGTVLRDEPLQVRVCPFELGPSLHDISGQCLDRLLETRDMCHRVIVAVQIIVRVRANGVVCTYW